MANISNLKHTERQTVPFSDSDVHGALDLSNLDAMDKMSQFLDAIIDTICGSYLTAELTKGLA